MDDVLVYSLHNISTPSLRQNLKDVLILVLIFSLESERYLLLDLDKYLLDTAVYLDAAAEPLVARLLARAQVEGRADDTAEVIANRLAVFAKETQPLVDYYEQRGLLVHIDGLQTPDEVTQAIITALDAL